MRARLRGPGGTSTITLPDDATIADLISEIAQKTSVPKFDVKYGYPPKPLFLDQQERSLPLSKLDIKLDGEQLTISPRDDEVKKETNSNQTSVTPANKVASKDDKPSTSTSSGFSFTGASDITSSPEKKKERKQVSLQRKAMEGDVPELPMPERGATLVLRVMPDDNSCLFRAFGAAVLPGDDLTMTELRSLVAAAIQQDPETYSQVVLEQKPDDYCRWIQTPDAWGGFIELGILAKHFDIEICSIDVQTLRIDTFNSTPSQPTRCILVYSGIHYDTIVQSPSEPPHLTSTNPPELDVRVFSQSDDYILEKALELCKKLQQKHYFTDTGGMAIKCNICGVVVYGEGQAAGHAGQTGHYDMAEVRTVGGK